MHLIYLGEPEEKLRMPRGTIIIDKVPPKSTYMDRNRSDIVISDTFISPSQEVMDKLFESARKYFEKDCDETKENMSCRH